MSCVAIFCSQQVWVTICQIDGRATIALLGCTYIYIYIILTYSYIYIYMVTSGASATFFLHVYQNVLCTCVHVCMYEYVLTCIGSFNFDYSSIKGYVDCSSSVCYSWVWSIWQWGRWQEQLLFFYVGDGIPPSYLLSTTILQLSYWVS